MASLAAAGTADARPKRRDARLAFDRGVTAYQKGDFEAASAALGRSYQLEHDVDTLFAWAQAERKLDHCDKAIELYGKLLEFKLPAENKVAVEQKLAECRELVAAQAPKTEAPPVQLPAPEPAAPPVATPPRKPAASLVTPPPPAVSERPPTREPPAAPSSVRRAWYRDPVTLALLGSGVVAGGVGAGFLFSAQSLGQDAKESAEEGKSYAETQRLTDMANQRGKIGLASAIAGGALVAGGVTWMFLRRDSGEQRTVTGWLAPGGGGLAIAGPF